MKIIIERGKVWDFNELPNQSIALDGAVQGPRMDTVRQVYSFDHHDNCIRMLTSATCRQVLDALLLGLNPRAYTVYINDVDGDTALSIWLLQNPARATEDKVRRLVDVVSAMDAHGPAYPIPEHDNGLCSGFYDHAMASERNARRDKTYATIDLGVLLGDCLGGIAALLDDHGRVHRMEQAEAPRTFTITHRGRGWVMAKSDSYIFDLLYKAGHSVAVAYQEMPDGSIAYTIGKKSDLVNFPIGPHSQPGTVLHSLAQVEAGWGGGSTIGGAPRLPSGYRSGLPPQVVENIMMLCVP